MTPYSSPSAFEGLYVEHVNSRTGLLVVALTVVATVGVAGLTGRAVAAAAAVDPWMISRAFRTRDDLLSALRASVTD